MRTTTRFPIVVVVLAFLVALALGAMVPQWLRKPADLETPIGVKLPAFDPAATWLQHPLAADSLRGRITVLVLFSDTHPCALRTLPEAEAWHRAYSRYGVRVIGVHQPEFAFAADSAVAARFVERLGLSFPILSDPSLRLSALLPRTIDRPSFYLADTSGRVVFEVGGERTNAMDRALRQAIVDLDPAAGIPTGGALAPIYAPPAPPSAIHLGTARVESGPLKGAESGRPQTFTAQFRFQEEGRANVGYPVGRWTPTADGIVASLGGPQTYVALRTEGSVWAVIAPPEPASTPARVWILAGDDWLEPGMAGEDVRFDARGASYLEIDEPRLYSIATCNSECVLKLSPEARETVFYAFLSEPSSSSRSGAAAP